jgi:hypothetical protein
LTYRWWIFGGSGAEVASGIVRGTSDFAFLGKSLLFAVVRFSFRWIALPESRWQPAIKREGRWQCEFVAVSVGQLSSPQFSDS